MRFNSGVIALLVCSTSKFVKCQDDLFNMFDGIGFDLPANVTSTTERSPLEKQSPDSAESDDDDVTKCTTDTGMEGECVNFYLCSDNGTIIEDGNSVLNVRYVTLDPCDSLQMCCVAENTMKAEEATTKIPEPVVPRLGGCGVRNPRGVGFEMKGEKGGEAQFGEFPWMVAILYEEYGLKKLDVYIGGGAIIHPRVVLTAAHVLHKAEGQKYKIRAGEWDTQHAREPLPHQERKVDQFIEHDGFKRGSLYNDISLMSLEKPFEMTVHVAPVCLPPVSVDAPLSSCFACGWGKDTFTREAVNQVILKKLALQTVARKSCQRALRKTRLGRRFRLHPSFVCAGGEAGQDMCSGDGGSPLVCPLPGAPERYMVSGLVAWGIGCGEDGTPGVYTNVAQLRTWIDEKLTDIGIVIGNNHDAI